MTAERPDGLAAAWTIRVDAVGKSGVENMTIDEGLLEAALRFRSAALRLYRWDPPTLSLGRNQSPTGIVREGVSWVRRPTGGQAVWHESEVTYAVAAPIAMFGSLRAAYREIHERIAAGLRSIGVDASLAPAPAGRPSRRPAACFAVPAGGEILVRGRKLVGSAQLRRDDAFLQHGSILLDGQQPGGGLETTLAAALGRAVAFDEVVDAVIAHWPSGRQAVRPVIASHAAR